MTLTARLLIYMVIYIVGRFMYKLLCIMCIFVLCSCQGIRNTASYNLELVFLEQGLKRQSIAVGLYLKMKCCKNGSFINDASCNKLKDTYVTVKERTDYHIDMMKYLGRLSEDRPKLHNLDVERYPICE